ncbi:MAG: hypothetical protein PHV32_17225, partial [Eubacteriales bacterium]|nr:hypothetical protein [Eubacteriales bacterium]
MFRRIRDSAGQIGIFLCIVLLSMVLIALILIDASRISSAERKAAKSLELAAKSTLAEYSTIVKEKFGLYSINKSADELGNSVREYLVKNLSNNEGSARLQDFKIESVTVTQLNNFTENDTVRSQILEYMKYRGPKDAVKLVIDKISAIKDTSKMSELYSKKIGVDAVLGSADQILYQLAEQICGIGGSVKFNINAFNTNGCRDVKISDIADSILLHRELNENLEGEQALLAEVRERIATAEEELTSLQVQLDSVLADIEYLGEDMERDEYELLIRERDSLSKGIELYKLLIAGDRIKEEEIMQGTILIENEIVELQGLIEAD